MFSNGISQEIHSDADDRCKKLTLYGQAKFVFVVNLHINEVRSL